MPRFSVLRALVLLPALLLAACDSNDDAPGIGGRYEGSVTSESLTFNYDFDIEETTGGPFDWTASLYIGDPTGEPLSEGSGTGTYTHPNVTFTDAADGTTFRGTVSAGGDVITVRVDTETVVLRRT